MTGETTTEAYRLEPSDQPAPGDSVFSLSLAMDGDRAIVSDTIRGAWIYEVSSNTELVRLDQLSTRIDQLVGASDG